MGVKQHLVSLWGSNKVLTAHLKARMLSFHLAPVEALQKQRPGDW